MSVEMVPKGHVSDSSEVAPKDHVLESVGLLGHVSVADKHSRSGSRCNVCC